ncbi:MAG: four helix bundle protein, partial [Planctomycetes bacterium]|nr:four helix bundle protein [Planctomycetota bacterium]
ESGTKITRVEDMPVYRESMELAIALERETRSFRQDFRWLRTQVLKSSESVPTNMTEGFYSQYSTEYLQAQYRCRREGRETQSHLHYAERTGQMVSQTARQFMSRYEEVLKQIGNLIGSIERKIAATGKAKPTPFIVRESEGEYFIDPTP